MIKWLSIFIAVQSVILCQKYNLAELVIGKRGTDSYRVWIYFSDKDGSAPIALSEKTIDRREGLLTYSTEFGSICQDCEKPKDQCT